VLLVAAGVVIGVLALRPADGQVEAADDARAIRASVAALPKCDEVFAPGKVIDDAKAAGGCLGPDGGMQAVGSFRCGDGRRLWQVDASTGAKAGWGFGGAKFVASADSASDPAYKRAYEDCVG